MPACQSSFTLRRACRPALFVLLSCFCLGPSLWAAEPSEKCLNGCPNGLVCDADGACAGPVAKLKNLAIDLSFLEAPAAQVRLSINQSRGNGAWQIDKERCSASQNPQDVKLALQFELIEAKYRRTFEVRCADPELFKVELLPGHYQVLIQNENGYVQNLPRGNLTLPKEVVFTGTATALALAVETYRVRGRLAINGRPVESLKERCAKEREPPMLGMNFQDSAAKTKFEISVPCSSPSASFDAVFPRGEYSLRIRSAAEVFPTLPQALLDGWRFRGDISPKTALGTAGALRIDRDLDGLVLDVKTFRVSGVVTANGAPPRLDAERCDRTKAAGQTKIELVFAERGSDEQIRHTILCSAPGTDFTVPLLPGRYDVLALNSSNALVDVPSQHLPYGTRPTGNFVRADWQIDVDRPNERFDIKLFEVSGVIRHNGAVPKSSKSCQRHDSFSCGAVHIRLSDKQQGLESSYEIKEVCTAPTKPFHIRARPGNYEVDVDSCGCFAENFDSFRVPKTLAVDRDLPGQLFDVTQHRVRGRIRLNGGVSALISKSCPVTVGLEDCLQLSLKEPTLGYHVKTRITTCEPAGCGFSLPLYPGTYQASLRIPEYAGGEELSVAVPLVVKGNAAAVVDLDVRAHTVQGEVLLNGAPPSARLSETVCDFISTDAQSLPLTFHALNREHPSDRVGEFTRTVQVACQPGAPKTFRLELPPGTYRVSVAGANPAAEGITVLSELPVQGDVHNLRLDLKMVSLAGYFMLHGKPLASIVPDCGLRFRLPIMLFIDPVRNVTVRAEIRCGQERPDRTTFTGLLPSGVYDVSFLTNFKRGYTWPLLRLRVP